MMRMGVTCRVSVLVASLLGTAAHAVSLTSLAQNASTVGRYEKFEATFTLDTEFANPFDANAVAIDVVVTCPDQTQKVVPAFYFRQYEVVGSGPENYRNPGPGLWKIRLAPSQTGTYRYDLRVTENDAATTTFASAGTFACAASGRRGPVRRDPNDVHGLCYADGSPRINIGHNVCWTNRGLAGFQGYYQKMQAAGENWTRLWMCHFSNCSALEWRPNSSGYFEGLGRYSLQIAQRLDAVVEAAEQAGIAIQLVLQHHGQFSIKTDSNWNDNPYNVTWGGMLTAPEQFFSDPEARRLTRNKYRYIVARWGYSSAIFAWELWNEVQFTDGWSKTRNDVVAWHREMAEVLRRIDPHGHLVTTSSDTGAAFGSIWDLPGIDLVQYHQYGSPQIESYRDNLGLLMGKYAKPVILGEFGIGQGNPESSPQSVAEPQRTQINNGLVLHNGIWAAFFAGSSGHLWWWDTYIQPLDLYRVFVPLQKYAEGECLSGLQPAPRVVEGSPSLHACPLILDFLGVSTQTEFWYDGTGFAGMDRLASYLHGSSKAAYASNPKFHVALPTTGSLVIHIGSVSSWGANRLRIWVNGRAVSTQTLVNGSSNVTVSVSLAAGEQVVQVENIGQDWAQISDYEFRPDVIAALASMGWMGRDCAYLWIYDVDNQYGRAGHGLISGQAVAVPGLADGPYEVTVWDTGGVGGVLWRCSVDSAGRILGVSLPDFTGDIALKVKPIAP
jgi:hypothetical protein